MQYKHIHNHKTVKMNINVIDTIMIYFLLDHAWFIYNDIYVPQWNISQFCTT